jgi:hypothetical protein
MERKRRIVDPQVLVFWKKHQKNKHPVKDSPVIVAFLHGLRPGNRYALISLSSMATKSPSRINSAHSPSNNSRNSC